MNLLPVLVLCASFGSQGAHACKFAARDWAELYSAASVVVLGRVEQSSNDRGGKSANYPASIRVERILKGSSAPGEVLQVWTNNSSCGLALTKGQKWLLLASGAPPSSNAPSGSVLLESDVGVRIKANEEFVRSKLPNDFN